MTGSVAMLERSVYSWMFGVRFTLDSMQIKPCLPKAYANSEITLEYMGNKVRVQYVGYGNKVLSASVNGVETAVENGCLAVDKDSIRADTQIVVTLAN